MKKKVIKKPARPRRKAVLPSAMDATPPPLPPPAPVTPYPWGRMAGAFPFFAALFLVPSSHELERFLLLSAGFAALMILGCWNRIGTALALAFLGLSLMAAHWVVLNPYNFLFPDLAPLQVVAPEKAALAGFLILVFAFALGGERPGAEMNPQTARFGLAVFLAVGAVLRLSHFREPHPTWGYDPFWEIVDLRNVHELDLHMLIFPLGGREPFFTYALAPLWWLFPRATPYVIANVGSAMIDLTGVWLLYLLGREMAGRRAGLFAAALGAVSKPLIIGTLVFTRGMSVTPAAALVALFTLRLFRNPSRRHFIQWGLALGAAAYTYMGIRVLLLWVVLSVLVFAFFRRGSSPPGVAGTLLAASGGAWITFAFLKLNAVFKPESQAAVLGSPPVLWGLFITAAFLWVALRKKAEGPSPPDVRHWFTGLGVACLLWLPLARHPLFASHLASNSVFKEKNLLQGFPVLFTNLKNHFGSLFTGGLDRYDMNISYDAFLDVLSIPAVLCGFAALLGRPRWRTLWLLTAAGAGILPSILSVDTHSIRLLCGFPPVLALSAVAVDRLWGWFRFLWPGRAAGTAGTVLLAGLSFLGAWTVHARVWGAFAAQADPVLLEARQVLRELPDKRVYLAQTGDFFLPHQMMVLLDGHPARFLKPVNDIGIQPGESVPPVVIYFCHGTREYGDDVLKVERQVFGAYPELHRTLLTGFQHRNMWRVEVPPEKVEEGGKGLFRVRRASSPGWRRMFFAWTYGLGRGGMIQDEDLVADPAAPLPQGATGPTCRVEGTLRVKDEGRVSFEVETHNVLELEVAGKKVLDHHPSVTASGRSKVGRGSVRLKAGSYPVVIKTYFRTEAVPVVKVKRPGETDWRPLSSIR